MIKSYLLSAVIIIVSCLALSAQNGYRDGYIVTSKGDSITGQIYYTSKTQCYKFCRFKKDELVTEYKPVDLRSFSIYKQRTFVSGVEEDVFVELLIKGELSLYSKDNTFFMKKEGQIYPLQKYRKTKDDGYSLDYKYNKWRGVVAHLVSDKMERIIDPHKFQFYERYLTELVCRYNLLGSEECVVSNENLAWSKSYYGIVTGINHEFIDFRNRIEGYDFSVAHRSITVPYVGLMINTCWPRISDNLSLQMEALFSNLKISSTKITILDDATQYLDHYLSVSKVSIPISVKYDIPHIRKLNWQIQAGAVVDYNIKADYKVQIDKENNSLVESYKNNSFEVHKCQFGIWGGISLSKEFNHFNGSLGLRYYKLNGLLKDQFVDINQERISIGITISTK